jgi:hypothetical protein
VGAVGQDGIDDTAAAGSPTCKRVKLPAGRAHRPSRKSHRQLSKGVERLDPDRLATRHR